MKKYHYFINYQLLDGKKERKETFTSVEKTLYKIMEPDAVKRLEESIARKVQPGVLKVNESIGVKITNINFLGESEI